MAYLRLCVLQQSSTGKSLSSRGGHHPGLDFKCPDDGGYVQCKIELEDDIDYNDGDLSALIAKITED